MTGSLSPHCRAVLEQAYLYLDGEMPDNDCAEIRSHLEECAPCLREFGLEQEFKTLIARKCGCDVVPIDLRERVILRLREVRIEASTVEFRID